MRARSFAGLLCLLVSVVMVPTVQAMSLTPGDLYSSNYFSNTIYHYNSAGAYIDSLTLPSGSGAETQGLAFGADGLLYAVRNRGANSGYDVVAIDGNGMMQNMFSGSGYIGGNISYGKIAVADNGQVFVAGGNTLQAFSPGTVTGSTIFSGNQIFDVEILPTGNLLVLSAYGLNEITPSGALVRAITPSIMLTDARGVEYDPLTGDIFVTVLGNSGSGFFRLMRLDGTSGQVEANVYFWYGDDMFLTADNRLIVGSRTQAPGIFDLNLNYMGSLSAGQQMFVTQMPSTVPVPAAIWMMGSGLLGLLGIARRRTEA